ncbi:TraR/DksA C4-type zinc finger protein [Oligella urethralis]|uniref:TraR/DksA C4-type zinc finger protein n=1 Tax=Oligella urethralis TaxID=90245 RepID=UPI00288B9800|nr:TraR/DksA C4-type zinc finger protein [Oligella urethralis]
MADIADIAQIEVDRQLAVALSKHTQMDTTDVDVESPRLCNDCDELIPAARVKVVPLCTRCVECQELAEKWT